MLMTIEGKKIYIDINSCQNWSHANNSTNREAVATVAKCLLSSFGRELPYDIRIAYDALKGPKAAYRGDVSPHEPTTVLLSVKGLNLRDQLTYQLAHELCHVLTNYEASKSFKRNKWLEESLCESASIFALRRLQEEWLSSSYGALRKYADGEEEKYQVEDLPTYFSRHRNTMERNACEGDGGIRMCRRISGKLAPYFLKNPSLWQECKYLNIWQDLENEPIEDYLKKWHQYVLTTQSESKLPGIIKNLLDI